MSGGLLLLVIVILLLVVLCFKKRESFDPYPGSVLYTSKERPTNTILVASGNFRDVVDTMTLPANVQEEFTEWIDKGFISPIKDQMSCGGCWAFATCATLADRFTIATNGKWKPTFGLSEQTLISCGGQMEMSYYQGCQGGIPHFAIDALTKYGTPLDVADKTTSVGYTFYQTGPDINNSCQPWPASTCPCTSVQNQFKQFGAVTPVFKTIGESHDYCTHGPNDEIHTVDLWPDIPPEIIAKNVDRMKKAIYYEGPITVGYAVYNDFYQFKPTPDNYYRYDQRSAQTGGHAVCIVGWKRLSDGTPVWIVKNSWGTKWGYGFDKPFAGDGQPMYTGGFWNHIMGKNDSFIESNSSGAHPDLTNPIISGYLPGNIPSDWYNTMTLRDIYEGHHPTPPKPTPTPTPTPSQVPIVPIIRNPFNTIEYSTFDLTVNSLKTILNDPLTRYFIASDSVTSINDIIKLLPQTTDVLTHQETIELTDQIRESIDNPVVIIIKGVDQVFYYLVGDVVEWNIFNLDAYIGKTTNANLLAEHIHTHLQMFVINAPAVYLKKPLKK